MAWTAVGPGPETLVTPRRRMIGSLAIAGSAPARRAAIAAPFTAAGNAFLARKLADDHLHAGLQVTARHHRQRSVALADRDLDRPRRPLLTLDRKSTRLNSSH